MIPLIRGRECGSDFDLLRSIFAAVGGDRGDAGQDKLGRLFHDVVFLGHIGADQSRVEMYNQVSGPPKKSFQRSFRPCIGRLRFIVRNVDSDRKWNVTGVRAHILGRRPATQIYSSAPLRAPAQETPLTLA